MSPTLFRTVFMVACLALSLAAMGQNFPVYSSYYINPFFYNPAEAGNEQTWLFVDRRQQWTGVEGSPVLTSLSFNTLLDQRRVGLGLKASSYERGLLNTTDLNFSYAYGVPLSTKSALFLGLSGGFISNSIDLNNIVDPDDPVIARYLANNFQPSASFGMVFKSANGINFGIALPQMMKPIFNEQDNFTNTTTDPFGNIIGMFYYRHKLDTRRRAKYSSGATPPAYAPLEFYALYKYSQLGSNQFEVMAKLNLSEYLWLGGAYRQDYGFAASAGIVANRLLIGYTYELGNQPEAGFGQTHELTVGLRLGKDKTFKRKAPYLRSILRAPTGGRQPRFETRQELPDKMPKTTPEPTGRVYYVITQAYNNFKAADDAKQKLIEDKYNAEIVYNTKDRRYYTYIYQTTKSGEASEEVRNLKNFTKLKTVRVVAIDR